MSLEISEPEVRVPHSWLSLFRAEVAHCWSRQRLLACAGVLALVLLAQFACTAVYLHQPPIPLSVRMSRVNRTPGRAMPWDNGQRLLGVFMLASPFSWLAGGNHIPHTRFAPPAAKIAADVGRTAWHFLAPGIAAFAIAGARRSGRVGDLRGQGWSPLTLLVVIGTASVGLLFAAYYALQVPYYLTHRWPSGDSPLALLLVLLNLRVIEAVWLVLLAASFRRPWRALAASGLLTWVVLPGVGRFWSEWVAQSPMGTMRMFAVTLGPVWVLELLMCVTIWVFGWQYWVYEVPAMRPPVSPDAQFGI